MTTNNNTPETEETPIPNNVRRIRETRLMNQTEFSALTGLSMARLSRVEHGYAQDLRPTTKRRILKALGYRPEDQDRVFGTVTEPELAENAAPTATPKNNKAGHPFVVKRPSQATTVTSEDVGKVRIRQDGTATKTAKVILPVMQYRWLKDFAERTGQNRSTIIQQALEILKTQHSETFNG